MTRAKSRNWLLRQAKLRLGLSQVKKRFVWNCAAKAMGWVQPKNNDAGWCVLRVFVEETTITLPRGSFVEPEKAPKPKPRQGARPRASYAASDAFLASYEWRQLRMVVLKKRGAVCECCGNKPPDVVIHVDHIKPRRKYPELALTESNLQVLCEVCNHGKGSWDETDWRADSAKLGESSKDSPVPETATATSMEACKSLRPRLIRRS